EPAGKVLRRDHHGHSIVQRRDDLIRVRGDHSISANDAALGTTPAFPHSCKRHEPALGGSDPPRLPDLALLLPFEKTVGGNKAAPAKKGVAEGGFGGNRFRPRIDGARAFRQILRP